MITFENIKEVLKDKLPWISYDEISNETHLRDDLGIDSLRLVDIIVAIEEKYDIEFDESDLEPSKLQRVCNLVEITDKTIAG